jgi:DNA-binding transcriptional LysR family regulator
MGPGSGGCREPAADTARARKTGGSFAQQTRREMPEQLSLTKGSARDPHGSPTLEFEFIAEFIVLADALHYGKAARQLKCDPSTLSKHIKKLEDQLGAVLFVRDRRTVTLTPAGHTFRQDAPRILDAVFQARRLAVRVSDAANSFVRVGQIGVGQDILRAALRSVHRQHPGLLTFQWVLADGHPR